MSKVLADLAGASVRLCVCVAVCVRSHNCWPCNFRVCTLPPTWSEHGLGLINELQLQLRQRPRPRPRARARPGCSPSPSASPSRGQFEFELSRVESAEAAAAETICGLAPLDNLLGSDASRLSWLTRSFAFVCFSLALIMMMMMIVQLPPPPLSPPALLLALVLALRWAAA